MVGMTTVTHTSFESTPDGGSPIAANRIGYLCRGLIAICICVGLLANGSWILGAYELVGPKTTAISLLLSIVIALGWPVLILFAVRRLVSTGRWFVMVLATALCLAGLLASNFCTWMCFGSFGASLKGITFGLLLGFGVAVGWVLTLLLISRRANTANRLVLLLGSIVCWGGPLLAAYVFVRAPIQKIQDVDWNPTEAEARSVYHRALVWYDPHDEFLFLKACGNESSLPYLIWGLRGMPLQGDMACTWGHGLDALRAITNQSTAQTRDQWAK